MVVKNKPKSPSYSRVSKTEVVCPSDTNPMGILQGGRLVQWMDIAAAVCAQTHAEKICVTATIDKVIFTNPCRVGDIVVIEAKITRAFTTSMEIYVQAWSKLVNNHRKKSISESHFTFVALDENSKPSTVLPIRPVSSKEKKLYEAAQRRRNEN